MKIFPLVFVKHRLAQFLFLTILVQIAMFIYFSRPKLSGLKNIQVRQRLQNLNRNGEFPNSYLQKRYFYQRGPYTVLTNFVQATFDYSYTESITFATHGTLGFLDNVALLVKFWSGPISIGIYAPGPEFWMALKQISYLRTCTPPRIAQEVIKRVTFHIFFETTYIPVPVGEGLYFTKLPEVICEDKFPESNNNESFRKTQGLLYPINAARNIAKENSRTHFVLVCDIELFPNPPDLMERFLDLMERRRERDATENLGGKNVDIHEVYVLPPFELSGKLRMEDAPRSKSELIKLLTMNQPLAFPFHFYACYLCHRFPEIWRWIHGNLTQNGSLTELNIFNSSPYITTAAWEPFYIGTIHDPPFDERLYRENALNKPIQAAILCHMNYTFHILDNAFLVHKPGLKYGKTFQSDRFKRKGREIVETKILPLQFKLYGKSKNRCWQIPDKSKSSGNSSTKLIKK